MYLGINSHDGTVAVHLSGSTLHKDGAYTSHYNLLWHAEYERTLDVDQQLAVALWFVESLIEQRGRPCRRPKPITSHWVDRQVGGVPL